ncbi:MAG TPA: hypothetical protein DIT89_02785 [Planctomycetaceae bacterium]|nr:hypothetical protein [Planctomycetaceae bacterium]
MLGFLLNFCRRLSKSGADTHELTEGVPVLSDSPDLQICGQFGLQPTASARVAAGFSEAIVWRVCDVSGAVFAVKCWRVPSVAVLQHRREVRRWMQLAAQQYAGWIPIPRRADRDSADGTGLIVERSQQAWQVESWCRGVSLVTAPTASELQSAAVTLLRLYASGREFGACCANTSLANTVAPSPAVLRRAGLVEELCQGGWQQLQNVVSRWPEAEATAARRYLAVLQHWLPWLRQQLQNWCRNAVPLQPVLRDLRAENLLFDAGEVSGVIDWDAAAVDHPCLDAARLLRTWHLNHAGQMAAAAIAWADHWQLSNEQRLLLIVLDASGVLLNPVVWFRRLSEASSVPDAVPEVGQRLRLLMSAAEGWQPLQL